MTEFPNLHEATLDEATVDALFADIGALTRVVEVIVKGAPRHYAADRPVSLTDARELLRGGQVRGVQVRYLYQQQQWWDTLLVTPHGMRLVRVAHDPAGPGCHSA